MFYVSQVNLTLSDRKENDKNVKGGVNRKGGGGGKGGGGKRRGGGGEKRRREKEEGREEGVERGGRRRGKGEEKEDIFQVSSCMLSCPPLCLSRVIWCESTSNKSELAKKEVTACGIQPLCLSAPSEQPGPSGNKDALQFDGGDKESQLRSVLVDSVGMGWRGS